METSLRLQREETDKIRREKEQLQRSLASAEAQLEAAVLISAEEKTAAEVIIATLEDEKSQLLDMQATLVAEGDQERNNATRAQQNFQEAEEKLFAATRTFELDAEEKLLEKNTLLNQVRASEVVFQNVEKKWRAQLEESKQAMQQKNAALLNQVRASEIVFESAEKKWRAQLDESKHATQRAQQDASALQSQCSEVRKEFESAEKKWRAQLDEAKQATQRAQQDASALEAQCSEVWKEHAVMLKECFVDFK
jgi:hypothetical protein